MVNWPVTIFWMAMVIVKAVLAARSSPFLGTVNLDEGILVEAGMSPIGAGLHDPPAT